MVNKLIDILGREAEIFESFLLLLEEQQLHLVNNDADGLQQVTERQREKVVESQLCNKQREALVEEIRVANAIDGDVNITRLLNIVDKNQAERLTQLRDLILSLQEQITTVRNQNALLLNRSREYISKMMTMLSKLHQPEGGYDSVGSKNANNAAVAVDRRA
ncbi:MAG: flagellar export chaperone FlgN [bacterium]|nr:flagellar export chaperone FlgN [bacterium]